MEPNTTINLIWVIIAAVGLLITVIASFIKSNREAERFESWLKTHEKEIQELKAICNALHAENKLLKDSMNSQYHQSGEESRRLERMISELSKSVVQIDIKLGFLIDGKLKSTTHE